MSYLFKRFVPFCLAACAGLGLAGIIDHLWAPETVLKSPVAAIVTPLQIDFVPNMAFDARKSGGVDVTLQLIAQLDASGIVKEIRPYPMLPYGVPESEAGHGRFANYTAMMIDGRFVDKLPRGFTETAVGQVSGIRFTPKTVEGQPVSQWVIVNTRFSYPDSPDIPGGDSIEMTVMDNTGTLFHATREFMGPWLRRDLKHG